MEAQQATTDAQTATTAEALRHAGKCILELVEKGEPMGDRQTFRRGYNAADSYIQDSRLSSKEMEAAWDKVGDVAGMALDHGIGGEEAAEFYYNQAAAIEN